MTYRSYDFYYISTRCAFKSSNKIDNSFYTSGRLLWIYILHQINVLNQNRPFVIYNQSTTDAYRYHLKMGMKPLNQTFQHIHDRQSIAYELFTLHYQTVPLALEYMFDGHNEPDGHKYGTLFFRSDDKNIDFSSPANIYYSMHNDFHRVLYTAGKKIENIKQNQEGKERYQEQKELRKGKEL